MLQVNTIRQNPSFVKERLAARHYANIELVDTILAIDDELRRIKTVTESLQASINTVSKNSKPLFKKIFYSYLIYHIQLYQRGSRLKTMKLLEKEEKCLHCLQ